METLVYDTVMQVARAKLAMEDAEAHLTTARTAVCDADAAFTLAAVDVRGRYDALETVIGTLVSLERANRPLATKDSSTPMP
jgi:hypothetical protein